ncbi:hypothetical protein MNB_SM-6-892 [hydrothermal vent metagenome]|uniref:PIN domain-containing protein n=1 Tax=hydrothermal vent metagenome TaxID=652676 RepID=A0A1W1CRX1_9ZZZZ
MVYLLDTNIIIRFLVGDHQEHLAKSIEIFKDIESAKLQKIDQYHKAYKIE